MKVKFADAIELDIENGDLANEGEVAAWVEGLNLGDARAILKGITGRSPKSKVVSRLHEMIVDEISKVIAENSDDDDIEIPTLEVEGDDELLEPPTEKVAKSKAKEVETSSNAGNDSPGVYERAYKGSDYVLEIDDNLSYTLLWPDGQREQVRSASHAARLVTGQSSINGRGFFGTNGSEPKSSGKSKKSNMKKNIASTHYMRLADPRLPLDGEVVTVKVADIKLTIEGHADERYIFRVGDTDLFNEPLAFDEACAKIEVKGSDILDALDVFNTMRRVDPWKLAMRIFHESGMGRSTLSAIAKECIADGGASTESEKAAEQDVRSWVALLERDILKDNLMEAIEGMGLTVAA